MRQTTQLVRTNSRTLTYIVDFLVNLEVVCGNKAAGALNSQPIAPQIRVLVWVAPPPPPPPTVP
jgi:hypothetical protein